MVNDDNLNEKIRGYFASYDSIDLISRLGALNLVFENQNKNSITTYATIYGLLNIKLDKPRASSKRFKELVELLNNSNILPPIIDPAESPFFEKLCIDKDYYLFNGINHSSVFVANNIASILLYHNQKFPKEFVQTYKQIIICVAAISTKIWSLLNLHWDDIKEHNGSIEKLIIPANLDFYQKLLFLNKEEFTNYVDEKIIDKYLICNNLLNHKFGDVIKEEYPFYYCRPFYKLNEDKYLLVDPTSLGVFIREIGIELADSFGCKDLFIKEYHQFVLHFSLENCKILSGISFGNEKIELELENNDLYDNRFFTISSEKLLYVLTLFDYGYDVGLQRFVLNKIVDKAFKKAVGKGFLEDNIYTVILISQFGGLVSSTCGYNFKNPPVMLNCDELKAVRIMQSNLPYFIERFSEVLRYYFDDESHSLFIGHSNLIAMLHERGFDVYFDDSFRVKGSFINLGFDFIYPYATKAASKEEEIAIFPHFYKTPVRLIKFDDGAYTINPLVGIMSDVDFLYTPLKNGGFMFVARSKNENSFLFLRVLSYWIYQLSGELNKYISGTLYVETYFKKLNEITVMKVNDKVCFVYYSKEFFLAENDNNYNEIQLIVELLKEFDLFTNDVASKLLNISSNKYKKISYKIDPSDTLYLKPLEEKVPLIPSSRMLESVIEDEIGEYIINVLQLPIGDVVDSHSLSLSIVDYLFTKFEKMINEYNWEQAINFSYLCTESISREMLLEVDNIKHQSALYPNHAQEINDRFNIINSTSVSSRFVVEYLSAVHTTGNRTMDYCDFQTLITFVLAIIKWAKISDALHCGLIDKLTILESYRIGFDKNKFNKFNEVVSEVSSNDYSQPLDFINNKLGEWPFKGELEEAYFDEYGFNTDQMMKVIALLVSYGEGIKEDIKRATIGQLIEYLGNAPDCGITAEILAKVIDYLSLKQRALFFDGTILNRNLYPWKYNRTHSLSRMPIVNDGENYIWGNRLLNHCYLFIMQTIFRGKEPSKNPGKGKIAVLNGKILKYEGDVFNDYCYEYLKAKMPNIDFYKQITSVNNKKIELQKNQSLGDIDILGIDKEKKRIYLIETKKFYYSRDPFELDIETKEMFVTTAKRKSFLQLELNRLEWVKNHIDDFVAQYNLSGNGWEAYYTFLSDKPLISCYLSNKSINHTSIKNIDLNFLRKLKFY